MDEIGILPNFHGVSVHDCFKNYFNYSCAHAFCNAHLLRELTFIVEHHEQLWAQSLIDLLLEIKDKVERERRVSIQLPDSVLGEFETKHEFILEKGFEVNPPPVTHKKPLPLNLLLRLHKYKKEFLGFMYDFGVPFDNNPAERDIRMMKVRQKISGTERSTTSMKHFVLIRSYISTTRKQGHRVLEALDAVFDNRSLSYI